MVKLPGTFFYKFSSSKKQKQKLLEVQSLKLQSVDGLFETTKLEKVKGSNIAKCVQKKYFNYTVDKVAPLRRNVSKALVIMTLSFFCFLLISIYQPFIHS